MRKWMMGLVAMAALGLTGCDVFDDLVCDGFTEATEEYAEKLRPCLEASESPPAINQEHCERHIEACTDTDAQRDAFDDYLECVDKLNKCSMDTRDAFRAAKEACDAELATRVSETCQTIVNDD